MNRHIYGLTVFLVIVKTHFLLYWLFFAPVNFVSMPEISSPNIVASFEKSKSCKMRNKLQIDLRSVEINIKEGTLYANADFTNLRDLSDLKGKRYVLHIFSESPNEPPGDDWVGEIIPAAQIREDSSAFVSSSHKLKQLDPKISYFAQIEFLSEHWDGSYAHWYDIQDSTPVLINAEKERFNK